MYNVIKKNQKKLMAAFAVLLMISFVATIGGRPGGSGRSDVVIAHMGKAPVYDSELRSAKEEWSWLNRYGGQGMMGGRVSLPARVFAQVMMGNNPMAARNYMLRFQAEQLGTTISDEIDKHPEMFLLLLKEAEANGLTASPDDAKTILKNDMRLDVSDSDQDRDHTKAMQDLLTVRSQLTRLMSAMKVSQPVWQHEAAKAQSVRLNLIDFRAEDFEKGVAAPTTQQVQEQFNKYKDIPPGDKDPLAFGYQIPTRVKLQYLEVPHAQVVDSVVRTIRPPGSTGDAAATTDHRYDWEVQAALYYESHKEEYFNPPPATQPAATQPGTQPTTVATSQPAYKPFEEVKQQIIEKLAASQIDSQARQIAAELSSRLAEDFASIRKENPSAIQPTTAEATTQPSVGPVALPAGQVMMLAHLEAIRADIDKKYGVAVKLHDIVSDWQITQELAKLPGIGTAAAGDGSSFTDYATSFVHPSASSSLPPLQVWEPSQPLTDTQHNAYVFRLTAAQPAHPPANLATIARQLEHDWKLAQAFDQAKQAAQKAFDSAKTLGLSQVARSTGQKVFNTDLFSPRQVQEVPGYPLTPQEAVHEVLAAAEGLITDATPADKHPAKLVELPAAQRVVVMELAGVQLAAPEWFAQLQVTEGQQQERLEKLAQEWFSYDKIVSRTDYKPVEKS
jgi:hypothetical protein